MNAYLIQDEGEHYVIVASSMQSAVTQAETLFVADNCPENEEDNTPQKMTEVRAEFRSLLQSCSLVGEVR